MRRTASTPLAQRLPMLATAIVTLAAFLSVRVVWLGTSADARAMEDPTYVLTAPRGSIWDRHGAVLATETYRYEVGAVPAAIENPAAFVEAVAPLLGESPAEVGSLVSNTDSRWTVLAREVDPDTADALQALDLAGLHLTPNPRRTYPLGHDAAHLTGFVNLDGKAHYGVEAAYDADLRGQPGRLVGALGTSPEGFRSAQSGADLVLTVDRTIQIAAADALKRALEEREADGGTVIVMDPASGDVLASVSLPAFDPNRYGEFPADLYLDPAVGLLYEPGSVMKAMTMAAALEAGVVAPHSTYEDSGVTEYGGIVVRNWDQSVQGTVSMTDLLRHSLNVGAVHLADGLGAKQFYAYLDAFGFGAPTGIGVGPEADGIVRQPGGDTWYPADLATNSFGQGMAATPIQVITAMAALANDGTLVAPRVVAARINADGSRDDFAPKTVGQVVSTQTARQVRQMLEHVVTGYAVQAQVPGYSVAGKTGTSEIPDTGGYEEEGTIASFVGFLPVEDPQLTILIKIDRPNTPRGSDAAAPVFRDVALAAITAMDIPPDRPAELLEGDG